MWNSDSHVRTMVRCTSPLTNGSPWSTCVCRQEARAPPCDGSNQVKSRQQKSSQKTEKKERGGDVRVVERREVRSNEAGGGGTGYCTYTLTRAGGAKQRRW